MGDGAHMGITAERALATILGGADQPDEGEKATPDQVRERIEAVPLFAGEKPWERFPRGEDGLAEGAYSMATDALAHAFLVLLEDDRSLLEPRHYPDDHDWSAGKQIPLSDVLWAAMKERWPGADEWVDGATGFMVGFATNTALYAGQFEAYAENPAIMEIGPIA